MPFQKIHSIARAIALFCYTSAFAQSLRREASDAFGTRIGDESVGLYSEAQVLGSSLQEADNYRLGNAYFVRGARLLSNSVVAGSTVRIEPNALGFGFLSPSDVAQFTLPSDARDRTEVQLGIADALQSKRLFRPGAPLMR